ncbi:MAG: hypothetical protein JSV49_05105 [Thermoplasmata archaeon]|nr:MAG: hypothetical protein JSV49_05105 [Thermoplasmata archaeon]
MTSKDRNDMARQARNLSIALGLLDNYWDKLSVNLSTEDQSLLTTELEKLEPLLENSSDISETNDEAAKFLHVFEKIEPLAFLSDLDESGKRGASLTSPDEEVKIKILNYCVTLRKKIQSD